MEKNKIDKDTLELVQRQQISREDLLAEKEKLEIPNYYVVNRLREINEMLEILDKQ